MARNLLNVLNNGILKGNNIDVFELHKIGITVKEGIYHRERTMVFTEKERTYIIKGDKKYRN